MDCFEKLNVQLHRLGVFQWNSDPKSKWITIATRCGLFIIYLSYFLAPAWSFLFAAQSTRKHNESLIFALGGLLTLSWYSAFLFQSKKYAAPINELNSIIEKSKSQAQKENWKFEIKIVLSFCIGLGDPTVNLIYEKTKLKIEWMTKYAYSTIQTVVLIYVLIPVILSLFNYFTSGFDNESFQQIFPAS